MEKKKEEQVEVVETEDAKVKFQEKLTELLALGKSKKNFLEYQEISDFFKDLQLDAEKMELVLDYLEDNGIEVLRIGDDDDDECSDCEEEEKLVSVNLAELLPAYEGGATVFSPEKVGNRLVEFAGIADNQYEEGAKKSLMAFAERMRDENVRYTELSLEAVFGGSDGMYWGFNEIIERIFLPEQASQLIAVLNIEDHALREELIFELDCVKDFTWTSVMDLMYMWDHFDDEQACYMRQTLRSDEYIDMVFTWGCDMRRGRDLDYKGKTT